MNHFITNLKDAPQYYKEVVSLIEDSFGYEKGNSVETDFAPLFSEINLNENFILVDRSGKDKEELVGHIGVRQRYLVNNLQRIKTPIALIGGVVVSSKFRGKGLFKIFMHEVMNIYKDKVSLFLLWSDLHQMYKKFGFHLAIGQLELRSKFYTDFSFGKTSVSKSKSKSKNHFLKSKWSDLSCEDIRDIENIYNKYMCSRYTSLFRSEADWENIRKIKTTEINVLKTNVEDANEGKVAAYYLAGKGQDLKNIVHELAIDWQLVEKNLGKNNLTELLLMVEKKYRVWLPEKERDIVSSEKKIKHTTNYMALVKINHGDIFQHFLEDWTRGGIQIKEFQEEKIYFSLNKKEKVLKEEDFLRSLWGPFPSEEWENLFSPSAPIFIPGVDSI